ncbi:MAG: leucine-rich repeat domain-containing protein [Ruminococcus sp.]|nr:leucine-rich repeat domain-containing protein [Ruminococcus sp.]
MKWFKKSISIVLSLLMIISVFTVIPLSVGAATYSTIVNGIEYDYTLNSDGTANLKCYDEDIPYSKRKSITLPKKLNGHKVISIDYLGGDFYDVEKVVIPEGVKKIGYQAFNACAYLKDIKFPSTIETIEYFSFIDETLWYEKQPAGVIYIGKVLFAFNDKEGEVQAPENIKIKSGTKTIAPHAFDYCETIKSVSIPNTVRTIGNAAFYRCTELTNLIIPLTTTSIGSNAFEDCSNLKDLYITNKECKIGDTLKISNNLTIHGAKGSTAQKFATKYNYTFSKLPKITLSKTKYNYNGKVKKPSAKVSTYSGKVLKKGVDYTLSYSKGRKNIGTYNVIATLKGKYKGIIYASFDIFPAAPKIKKVKANKNGFTAYIKIPKGIKNFSVEYSQSKKFKKGHYGYTVFSKRKSKVKINWLIGGKKYYVRLVCTKTVGDYIYSSDYSKIKSVRTKK